MVDNASTDDSAAAVRAQFPAVRLAELTRNTGGAGGFAYGMALALAGRRRPHLADGRRHGARAGALAALLDAPRPPARGRPGADRQPGGVDRRARRTR